MSLSAPNSPPASGPPSACAREIERGERFAFGRNWRHFAAGVDDDAVARAEHALRHALAPALPDGATLTGRTFLDAGSGSGLAALAAVRMGARVHAFDFDPDAVDTTGHLLRTRAPHGRWTHGTGSVLDPEHLASLGLFDVVHSWGVLHHTGALWTGLGQLCERVAAGGVLYVSLYNDQGLESRIWRRVKCRYNQSGPLGRRVLLLLGKCGLAVGAHPVLRTLGRLHRLLRDRSRTPDAPRVGRPRGMSRRHDLLDWIGGYPFEVARPDEVFAFCRDRGFELRHLKTCGGGIGCNEFVFRRG